MISLSEDERAAFTRPETVLPLGVTPYYMSLVSRDDPESAHSPHGHPHGSRNGSYGR
jgi:L-lysine 2,3-aminomutase